MAVRTGRVYLIPGAGFSRRLPCGIAPIRTEVKAHMPPTIRLQLFRYIVIESDQTQVVAKAHSYNRTYKFILRKGVGKESVNHHKGGGMGKLLRICQ